jgi:hypothetical protein
MHHIRIVKPVIPQVIHKYLIGREIIDFGVGSDQFFDEEEQHRLAQLIGNRPVLEIPYRTNSQTDPQSGIPLPQLAQQGDPMAGKLSRIGYTRIEITGREFMAIGDQQIVGFEKISLRRAESKDQELRLFKKSGRSKSLVPDGLQQDLIIRM